MKPSVTRAAFLEALKAGLWARPLDEQHFKDLKKADWVEIFNLSFHQTVEGILADAISSLPTALLPPQEIWLKWMVRLQHIEQKNKAMDRVIRHLFDVFDAHDIGAVLQKGHGVSLYYEKPHQRVAGDIDLYFPLSSDYHKANDLMRNRAKKFSIDPAFSSSYIFEGMEIEQHQRLVQLRNPLVKKAIQRLHQAENDRARTVQLDGRAIPIPSPILNIIQVNAHILKHQVTYGIGLRQLCDAARLYHIFSAEIDEKELRYWYKKLGMLTWAYTFHEVLVDLVGLDRNKLPFQAQRIPDFKWMSKEIMQSGNFGFYDPKHPDHKNPGGRVNRVERLSKSFRQYIQLAPMETLSFPFFQVYSKVFRN